MVALHGICDILTFTKLFKTMKLIIKSLYLTGLFVCMATLAQAQVYTGGNVSVGFDNNTTYADIAPVLGYQMGKARVGVSPVFNYSKTTNQDAQYSFGARLFGQYTVFQGFFLHAEFESLNVEDRANDADGLPPYDRTWVVGLPVGAGYNQQLTDRINAQFMVLWNVIENENAPTTNPIIRGGINYSF
jgi:hypothetical protein